MKRKKRPVSISSKKIILGIVYILLAGVLTGAPALFPAGPLYTKNLYALYIPIINLSAESAACLEPGTFRMRLAHNLANTFRVDYGEELTNFIVDVDQENHNLNIELVYGFSRGFDIAFEGSLYFRFRGALDAVINGFHNLFQFPGSGRDDYPSGRSRLILGPLDDLWVNSTGLHWEYNNILLKARLTLLSLYNNKFLLSFQPALKIPLAGPGFVGSGSQFEPALCALLDIRLGFVSLYLNGGWLYAGIPFDIPAEYLIRHLFRGALGGEWQFTRNLSLSCLLSGITSPYRVDHRLLGFPCITLSTGVKAWLSPGLEIQVGFSEEIFFYGATDIQFFSSLKFLGRN